ncbi:hypothetical protein ACIP6T_23115 [Pantoea sp. NPDC088449]|uniref:MrpH family fimbial adhesin n=1 Tax=Pantoea sp. NPDC088449 TaxID=3364392 RepID=UPI003805D38B
MKKMTFEIKKLFNISILTIFLLIIPLGSHAIILAHITKVESSSSYIDLWGSIDLWEELEDSPNPCYQTSEAFCYYHVGVINKKTGQGFPRDSDYLDAKQLKTMQQVVTEFKKIMPIPFPIVSRNYRGNSNIEDFCFGILYCSAGACDQKKIVPGNICLPFPPITLSCTVTGDTMINHGTLPSNELSGAKSSTVLNVSCNQDGTLTIYALGQGSSDVMLNSEGTLKSRLQVNGKSGIIGTIVEIKEDVKTPFTITSELITFGEVEVGPFHGSGTVTMSYE